MEQPTFLIVDLFCGFGGTTTGFHLAEHLGKNIARVIACINHDPKAIRSHWLNNPSVKHFNEDIRTLDLTDLCKLVAYYRALFPHAKLILWASLECTNFSRAKGGLPRDADSRTLADHLLRYIAALNPDYVEIENVIEFRAWGPLDANGKPVSYKSGQDWLRWRKAVCAFGYTDDWRELNSADYGAYTSRNRLFGIFAKQGLPIAWPEATHAKKPDPSPLYGQLAKWKAVKEVLHFEDRGKSIFNRKKPLSDASLRRIYAGLLKYVAQSDPVSIYGPGPDTLVPSDTAFLTHYYSGGGQISAVDVPCTTITAMDGKALITPLFFLEKQYGKSIAQSVNEPAGTVMPHDKHRLVTALPLPLFPADFEPVDARDPANAFLLNPSWGGHAGSIDAPCCVLIARQDKAPLYFVQVEPGSVRIPVYATDSEIMVKIKEFMAAYGLIDIKMRMLRVVELLKIQGFPADYQMFGNQAEQKKFIGNSVVPLVVKSWTEALAFKLINAEQLAA